MKIGLLIALVTGLLSLAGAAEIKVLTIGPAAGAVLQSRGMQPAT
jgi:hypothetical protein